MFIIGGQMAEPKIETLEEALKRGVVITKVDTVKEAEKKTAMHGQSKNALDIMTLGEAADFYGEKSVRKAKTKKIDLTGIDRQYIPESLQYLFDKFKK